MSQNEFKRLLFCYFTVSSFLFSSATAHNPIISQKYTADPSAMIYNDRIYVYCSRDDNNRDNYDIVDYTLISSDDLVNWTDHGEVFKVPRDAKWAQHAYAPSCIHRDGKFYLYFPDGGDAIGVAVADKPEGPFQDPLGKALINRSMPNCNVPWVFDPCAFIDDDGQAYLYFGGGDRETGRNLRVIKLNKDMISVDGEAVTIEARESFEAAYMHKHNGTYYFSYATTGASKIDYLTSKDPMTGFTYAGTLFDNPTLNGQNINRNNNNHTSVIFFKDKWYLFYHDRRLSNEVYKRNVSVDLLTYNANGKINKVTCTSEGPPQIKHLNPYDTVQAETMDRQKGIKTDICSEGGIMLTSLSDGDYTSISGVDFGEGAKKFEVRAASASSGGSIELRLGSTNGKLAGTCNISSTGGWSTWETFTCDVTGCSGIQDLYLVYKGTGEPYRLNWYRFIGEETGVKLKDNHLGKTSKNSPRKVLSFKNNTFPSSGESIHDLSGRLISKQVKSGSSGKSEGLYIFSK
jgi:arabinoxylan arabinofuranohydrolase